MPVGDAPGRNGRMVTTMRPRLRHQTGCIGGRTDTGVNLPSASHPRTCKLSDCPRFRSGVLWSETWPGAVLGRGPWESAAMRRSALLVAFLAIVALPVVSEAQFGRCPFNMQAQYQLQLQWQSRMYMQQQTLMRQRQM